MKDKIDTVKNKGITKIPFTLTDTVTKASADFVFEIDLNVPEVANSTASTDSTSTSATGTSGSTET